MAEDNGYDYRKAIYKELKRKELLALLAQRDEEIWHLRGRTIDDLISEKIELYLCK